MKKLVFFFYGVEEDKEPLALSINFCFEIDLKPGNFSVYRSGFHGTGQAQHAHLARKPRMFTDI